MRLSVVLLGTLALAISASADQIDFVWSPTDFQTIPTPIGQIAFFPTHINDAGVVAGDTNPGTIVTTWSSQGGFEDHPIPAGYRFGYSGTISNTGVVLGGFSSNGSDGHAAIWNPDGTVVPIGAPTGAIGAAGYDLNDRSVVIGNYFDNSYQSHPFLWNNGTLSLLDGTAGFAQTTGYAINNSGLVVGYVSDVAGNRQQAVFWANGSATPTVLSCAGSYAAAYTVNNLDQIAGACGAYAALWDQSGNVTLLGVGEAYGINDLGQVVGDIYSQPTGASSYARRPFVWSDSTGVQLLAINSGNLGFANGYAYDINNLGQIIGSGELATPEPSSTALVVLGLSGAAAHFRLRRRASRVA